MQVQSLGAQLHTHIGQQRVRELLQEEKAKKPSMTADELSAVEFAISTDVFALIRSEAARIEALVRDEVRNRAQSDPEAPAKGTAQLN